jgi:peptidoglycan hydrolase-like protein with peptidoglycan-binding domain
LAVRRTGVFTVGLALVVLGFAGPALASPQQAGVQVALRAAGLYCGPIDGQVGPLTQSAVEAAQKNAGLPVTGAITTRTRDSLGPLGRPLFGKRTITPGDFGLDVSVLQFLLARAGFYHGALDGYMGPKAEAAVRGFQQHASLSVDGIAGPLTLTTLVRATRAHPAAAAPAVQAYVVQPGDSLTAIADHFEVSLGSLAQRNHLDPANVLIVGTRLTVPVQPAHAALAASPTDVRSALDVWAQRLGVSDSLVRALAWMESGYQPNVVSSVGAQGVMQVMPTTRDYVEQVLVGHPIADTVDGNIEVGVLYLRHLLSQFGGDTNLALGAWYQGEAAVRQFGLYQMTKPFVADVLALQQRM